jgi:hypothetical protein
MPLYKVTKQYSNKPSTTEIVYGNSPYVVKPNGETSINVSNFKYHVKGITNPAIINFSSGKIIGPYNIECHPMTTLNDIVWERPEIKQDKVAETFESKSGLGQYKTTFNPNNNTYKCTCFGYFRAKDRQCKHIKALKEKSVK